MISVWIWFLFCWEYSKKRRGSFIIQTDFLSKPTRFLLLTSFTPSCAFHILFEGNLAYKSQIWRYLRVIHLSHKLSFNDLFAVFLPLYYQPLSHNVYLIWIIYERSAEWNRCYLQGTSVYQKLMRVLQAHNPESSRPINLTNGWYLSYQALRYITGKTMNSKLHRQFKIRVLYLKRSCNTTGSAVFFLTWS